LSPPSPGVARTLRRDWHAQRSPRARQARAAGGRIRLELCPTWCRDATPAVCAQVVVLLTPEGSQLSGMAKDIAAAATEPWGSARAVPTYVLVHRGCLRLPNYVNRPRWPTAPTKRAWSLRTRSTCRALPVFKATRPHSGHWPIPGREGSWLGRGGSGAALRHSTHVCGDTLKPQSSQTRSPVRWPIRISLCSDSYGQVFWSWRGICAPSRRYTRRTRLTRPSPRLMPTYGS
jgi:hypothetical protein